VNDVADLCLLLEEECNDRVIGVEIGAFDVRRLGFNSLFELCLFGKSPSE
jgi:hypothetical protein